MHILVACTRKCGHALHVRYLIRLKPNPDITDVGYNGPFRLFPQKSVIFTGTGLESPTSQIIHGHSLGGSADEVCRGRLSGLARCTVLGKSKVLSSNKFCYQLKLCDATDIGQVCLHAFLQY